MIVVLDIKQNLILYALEREAEFNKALNEALKIEKRAKGTSLEGKLKYAIKYIWELV